MSEDSGFTEIDERGTTEIDGPDFQAHVVEPPRTETEDDADEPDFEGHTVELPNLEPTLEP